MKYSTMIKFKNQFIFTIYIFLWGCSVTDQVDSDNSNKTNDTPTSADFPTDPTIGIPEPAYKNQLNYLSSPNENVENMIKIITGTNRSKNIFGNQYLHE